MLSRQEQIEIVGEDEARVSEVAQGEDPNETISVIIVIRLVIGKYISQPLSNWKYFQGF